MDVGEKQDLKTAGFICCIVLIIILGGAALAQYLVSVDIDAGGPHNIMCYSGGHIIYSGQTAGGIRTPTYGVVIFRDAKSGTKMTIRNAACMVSR